jgi:multidrug efflux pump subunit AcrB
VTTVYPGASSAVVDGTVAQPIEAQLVGVDKMMYMKSVSGDDGSYALTASFELGTDPDTNTVNVNNRVQIALSGLPQEVQRQGVTVKKQPSALRALAIPSCRRSFPPGANCAAPPRSVSDKDARTRLLHCHGGSRG